jgi:hypothetical protein
MDPNTRLFAMGAAGQAVAIPDIGGFFEGGYVAGYISDTANGTPTRVLIVAPKSGGEITSVQYKTTTAGDTNPPSQNSVYGKLATDFFTGTTYPAFNWAKGLSINGYTDWYIPAKNELEILYRNLKPTTTSNNTSSGANANGVTGATANYTSGSPAQTSVTAFQTGNSEAFASASYWSSSESSGNTAAALEQTFSDGSQSASRGKVSSIYARAIRSVSIIPTPGAIGTAYEGGYYAGQIQVSGIVYNLVVAPKSGGENTSVQYKTSNTADTNPNSQNLEYGKLATDQFNDSAHPAFQWASGLTINGFSDWYIPARNELEILYRNLKPTTDSNNTITSSGANSNAVPSATPNYTSGSPAQTSVTAFQTGNSEAFASALYWSSSEFSGSTSTAWSQFFVNGTQGFPFGKTDSEYARAIRRVAA